MQHLSHSSHVFLSVIPVSTCCIRIYCVSCGGHKFATNRRSEPGSFREAVRTYASSHLASFARRGPRCRSRRNHARAASNHNARSARKPGHKALTRASEFTDILHVSRPSCEDVQPPEALATPDPLFTPTVRGKRVKVSFIIGTDGHVHSPLILESAGLAGDRHVLQTVRTWRYRPATCNGVPTETEGKIEFSSR